MGKDMCGSTGIGNTVSGFFFFFKEGRLTYFGRKNYFFPKFLFVFVFK